ncbi:MAG: hypothetical protein LBU65_09045 [Planctomycetaceae bacterium]|nr:hypothetical protein [Planctomycetaceae bacterium]
MPEKRVISKQKITSDVSNIAGISYPMQDKFLGYLSQAGWHGSQAGSQGLHGSTQRRAAHFAFSSANRLATRHPNGLT